MAQHPLFVQFGELFRAQQFEQALVVLDQLIEAMPSAHQLAWHRANCLEALGRFEEVPAELDKVLARSPNYVPAIIKRVRYTPEGGEEVEEDPADLLEAGQAARADATARHVEAELRRALTLQADNLEAIEMLMERLRYRADEGSEAARTEIAGLLDRAIALAPDRVDLLETRANALRAAARNDGGGDEAPDGGDGASRTRLLERVVSDYERCLALTGHHRYAVRMGMVQHDLGRWEQALGCFDLALAGMDDEDPMRAHIEELRSRALQTGMPEAVPDPLEGRSPELGSDGADGGAIMTPEAPEGLADASKDGSGLDLPGEEGLQAPVMVSSAEPLEAPTRSLHVQEDEPASPEVQSDIQASGDAPGIEPVQAPAAATPAVSMGLLTLPLAIEAEIRILPEDAPETVLIKRCVQKVMTACYPPLPQLVEVDPAAFPAYQKLFAERVGKELVALGIDYIGDACATGLSANDTLIRCFADEEGEFGVIASASAGERPDWQAYLTLRLSRQWQASGEVECLSQFADGTHLWTRRATGDPFEYGEPVRLEQLPAGTPFAELVGRHAQRHAAFRAAHPEVAPLIAHDVEGTDLRWQSALVSRQSARLARGLADDQELMALLGEANAGLLEALRTRLQSWARQSQFPDPS